MRINSLAEATKVFNDERRCLKILKEARWGDQITCPLCKSAEKIYTLSNKKQGYKCGKCKRLFSAIKGTIFEQTHIPLKKWFLAVYLMASHKKGISSVQLASDLGVTQKSAWFMLQRIRKAFGNKTTKTLLTGIIEIDETYMGRKFRSEYVGLSLEKVERIRKREAKGGARTKGAVIGLKQRGGDVVLIPADRISAKEIKDAVDANVSPDALLMTDESMLYRKKLKAFKRQTVNHSRKEWVRGDVHTNGAENIWSLMKRGVYGTYHSITAKHLHRYCAEFEFRINAREMSNNDRFKNAIKQMECRLTYKELIKKGNN